METCEARKDERRVLFAFDTGSKWSPTLPLTSFWGIVRILTTSMADMRSVTCYACWQDREPGTEFVAGNRANGQSATRMNLSRGMMKTHAMALAAALMTVVHVGCSSVAPVTRGQSPTGGVGSPVQTVSHDHHSAADTQSFDAMSPQELHQQFHGQQISYYPPPGGGYGPYGPGYGCPPYGGPGGTCPVGYHDSYVMGPCGPACGPRHHLTHSYSCPTDLRYPDQSTTGGAVVYPYYTHRGPSCFFRDDDRKEY